MSDYTEISLTCLNEKIEILIAELFNIGYEGFWETEDGLKAYILKSKFKHPELQNIIQKHILSGDRVSYQLENIPTQNWNEKWEKSFDPVIIADKYLIKAPFHLSNTANLTSFTISPKMAFGTGHHSTTQLMMESMLTIDFANKKVLDLGTGTGLLAIFAEHLGAKYVVAIDNSIEAIDCVLENIIINNCKNIKASVSEINQLEKESFDIILANINRNTLGENVSYISAGLKHDDILLISGFYENDIHYISSLFEKENLKFKNSITKNTWVACQYIKD